MKENLLICVCHQFEILGEESVLGLKKRDFSIQASTLDSQVYRISHYDLENVYKNLTNNREDNYFNLLESLIQKREWKLDRFSELFNKFLKERKLMHSNTINYARLTSIHSSSQRKIALSQGASPNNLKLKAIQNQYSAKLNFTNAFQSLGEYTKQAEEDQVQETSKFRSYSQSIGQKSSSRQQSQRQIKASHRSQTSSSSSEDNNNEDQQSINQFTAKPNNEYEANDGSNKCIEQYDQSQNQNSSIIQKLFDPDSYYKKLQLKIKKANDIKQTKYQPQKLDHNKILNLDYTPQSSRKENQNQDSNKSPKIKQFNKYSLSPFNNGFKQDQQKNQQQYQLKLNQQNPNFKSQTGKMKLSEEDEKALEDYYKLKILPISVVFSKADESNQKRISSSNDQMLQRLKLLGIETPKKSQLNKTQDDVSPKKAFKIRKSESTGQLHNQNLNSPAHSKESDRQNNRQSSVLKASQFQQKQNQRASLDQNSFIQIIREKNGSISEQKINPGNTPKLNNSTLSIIKEQYNQNDEGMSKTQQNINENMKLQGEVGNLLKKEKEEQEQYKKQKQFIDTMKSYADVYKLVEMNYLESHSIKAHQLMKETMDDMNLIRKFAQQTYKKNTNSIVTNFAKQEFQKKLMKKQKQEKFEKLKKRGLINENEVNMDDSIELNQHLKKIADLQQQIYDNINDPTGSRSNNYNFGGLKKRKVGVQLSDQINLFQQMPAFQQSIPQTNESITEESLSNISQVQINENPSKNAISNIIDNQKKDENLIKNESNQNQKQQILQKKTMGVLAMMQKQYKQSIDQPIQKNLEIFNLKNKFQKSAQLRLFKQLKQEEQNSNNKGLSIFNTLGQINKKNEIKDKINKFEPQKSMEAFVQRGFQRQSNTQYLSNLFFGQISHSKDHKEPNDTHSKLPKNGLFSNQSIGSLNQNQTNTTLKPYQHINNIKPSEFSQFNSVWDNSKKQLQFQRILNYNR
ncbi:cyclic nucleotide-binding domain protein (macronuclear) [Tetrahymena thermophila SB210]|uniref:Cyclic nucleotide-binding domain protein n=1 Tax=Tetrahymena thermophila (strain SB210) TaxID=312017 RepID=I7MKR5_TETTS|nr:cyclic nucleotide-binding domain protein [Tetrahymena thermophila SB210]EAR99887.2 cyclic nucleotide-binding domain protein [Tetrahymena thermophila SB210]|eukprot:XP_001020132.2 cyclic nucleotide-binding domain protein [Tetrahymena thermophila SB210]